MKKDFLSTFFFVIGWVKICGERKEIKITAQLCALCDSAVPSSLPRPSELLHIGPSHKPE